MIHCETGEILFTDYGVSGICIMQCARFINSIKAHFELNFIYKEFTEETLIKELLRRQRMYSYFSPSAMLDGILNAKLSYAVMKQAGIPLKGETAGDLSENDIRKIARSAANYRIEISGTRGFEYAQVTAGGADCREFFSCTMESKIVPGLYAAGEVLNVDGDCGGFNLMFAFASGMIAGKAV